MGKIDIVKFRQFDKLDIETFEHAKSLPPLYNQKVDDVFLVGYKVDAVSEDGADEPEIKVLLKDILAAGGGSGTPGPAGADGKSAYEIWLENGHEGSEVDFLNDLIGPQGPAGINGASLEYDWQDTKLGVRVAGSGENFEYVDLKGPKGDPGSGGGGGGISTVQRRDGGVDVKTLEEVFAQMYPNHNIDDYRGKVLSGKTKLLVDGAEDPCLIFTYLPIPEDGTPGGDSGETQIIAPDLQNVYVQTHTTDMPSTGSFDAVAGAINSYNLNLDLQTVKGDDGESLEFDWQGTSLGVRRAGSGERYQYVDLKGQDGTGVAIKPSEAECVEVGDGYIDEYGHLQMLSNVETRLFKDCGEIRGPKGRDGVDGTNGIDGKSVYAYAQKNQQGIMALFVRDEKTGGLHTITLYAHDEMVNGQIQHQLTASVDEESTTIVIADGPAGPAGADGPAGPAGADGSNGADGADGHSVESVELEATDNPSVYNMYTTINGVRSFCGSFTIPSGPVDVDHNIKAIVNTVNANGVTTISDLDDQRTLHWQNIANGVDLLYINYNKAFDGHDDYIVIDNKSNTKDLTVNIGALMYNMTEVQGAEICKPDPFVVPAGKAVELNVKILSQGSVCTCSVLQQQQEQQPQPVADSGISLYRMEVIADDIDYEQASDFATTEIAKYDMTAQQINVKKWNPETKSYNINVDLEEFIHSIEDGTQVVDVCPDTENAMNVATNFLYGLYAMFDASLINYNSEKFPTECGFVFHSLKRVPVASASFNPFVFTVKVYSNIQ